MQATWPCHTPPSSLSLPSQTGEAPRVPTDGDSKGARFRWTELVTLLLEQPQLSGILDNNLKLLFLSRQRLLRTPNVDPHFKQLFLQFDSQTCLKALSTVIDLSDVKMNQYKFMCRSFTLGKAARLLISEGFFLYRNLVNKSADPQLEFNRLVNSWIDFVFAIHNVPPALAPRIRQAIIEAIMLNIQGRRHQIKGRGTQEEETDLANPQTAESRNTGSPQPHTQGRLNSKTRANLNGSRTWWPV